MGAGSNPSGPTTIPPDPKLIKLVEMMLQTKVDLFGERKAHHKRAPHSLILKTSHEVLITSEYNKNIAIKLLWGNQMSQAAKPTGFFGKLSARGMALGHRGFYENTAKILNLTPDDTYLEIGFGSGLFIKKYASHVKRIAGIDYSEDIVKLASDINKNLVKLGKAEFIQGDVSTLPWNDNEFSAVAGIETFFFWPKPQSSLREIFRVLVPGGRLVLEMAYNRDDGKDHAKDMKKYGLILYSGEEMRTLLEESGFSEISIVYYKSLWIPFKGYVVPKGMIAKATKS